MALLLGGIPRGAPVGTWAVGKAKKPRFQPVGKYYVQKRNVGINARDYPKLGCRKLPRVHRREQVVEHPPHYAAYAVDGRLRGQLLGNTHLMESKIKVVNSKLLLSSLSLG